MLSSVQGDGVLKAMSHQMAYDIFFLTIKSFSFQQIKEHKIIYEIKVLKGNKSPGADGIKLLIIKGFNTSLAHSLTSTTFSLILEYFQVFGVFKKGDERYHAKTYKPIPLKSCF